MSDQTKSNYQALGAGLLGFFAVVFVGGGALMLHSSQRAKSAAAPSPAAAPIDLASSMPAPPAPRSAVRHERRAESPAPLIGEVDESPEAEAPADSPAPAAVPKPAEAPAAVPSPESAPSAKASALEVVRHLEAEGGSTAEASVKNTAVEAAQSKKAKAPAKLPSWKAPKVEAGAGDGALASTVHYGVTSRSELMGRAAGPVYNIKGGQNVAAPSGTARMAEDADGKIADMRRQLEAAGLPPEQRDKLLKELDAAIKRASDTGKTAQ